MRALGAHARKQCVRLVLLPDLACPVGRQVVRADRGMRALFEAVHQDFRSGARYVNAWHAEGAAWTMSGEDEPRVRFWGTSIDMHLHWNVALTFADGEAFSWRKVRWVYMHCQQAGRAGAGFVEHCCPQTLFTSSTQLGQ